MRPVLFTFVVYCLGSLGVLAQTNVLDSDPLVARELVVYDMLGVYIGPSFNQQGGTFTTNCDCNFTGGAGAGISGGVMFERLTRSRLTWGVIASVTDRGMMARFLETEGVEQTSPTLGARYVVPVQFRNEGTVGITSMDILPYAKYIVLSSIFGRVGLQASYIFQSSMKHTKELLTETVQLPNGETARVALQEGGATMVTLQDGALPKLNTFQVAVAIAGGAELKVSKKVVLSPVVQYLYPLTSVSGAGSAFSSRSLQLLAEFRYIF
jgi:hypothetical protein